MTYQQMLKKQELNKEFSFTGMCERAIETKKIDEMKARAKVEYKGYKTRVVRENNGVAIYVEKKWFDDEAKHKLEKQISRYEDRKINALKKYEEELAKLAEEQAEYVARLEKLNNV